MLKNHYHNENQSTVNFNCKKRDFITGQDTENSNHVFIRCTWKVHSGETGVGVGLASLKVVEMAEGVGSAGRKPGNRSAGTLSFEWDVLESACRQHHPKP
jgi:hypothetical protein